MLLQPVFDHPDAFLEWIIRFNTASGKCCCNFSEAVSVPLFDVVSIPQAVSAVATRNKYIESIFIFSTVSIPQAVSAVATDNMLKGIHSMRRKVSIPQAVSAVATSKRNDKIMAVAGVSIPQAVSAVATRIRSPRRVP